MLQVKITPHSGFGGSIQEAKKPKRNFISSTDFGVIDGEETVREILDLLEGLFRATDLEKIPDVDSAVTFAGKSRLVTD